ncbi:MAG TPA: biliverdin-producing heme oxygenase [Marinagarivorans sp.]
MLAVPRHSPLYKSRLESAAGIAEQLKLATRDLHRTVERTLAKTLFSPLLTATEYLAILVAMQRSYTPLEALLRQYPATRLLIAQRHKLDWLKADIAYVSELSKGAMTPASAIFRSTVEPPLPARSAVALNAPNEAQALGVMYVMEGATLGGSPIQLALGRHPWLSGQGGLQFFNAYGAERSAMWMSFLETLQSYADQHPNSAPAIIAGAEYAFNAIHQPLLDIA